MCISNTHVPVSVSTVGMCVHDILCMVCVTRGRGRSWRVG